MSSVDSDAASQTEFEVSGSVTCTRTNGHGPARRSARFRVLALWPEAAEIAAVQLFVALLAGEGVNLSGRPAVRALPPTG